MAHHRAEKCSKSTFPITNSAKRLQFSCKKCNVRTIYFPDYYIVAFASFIDTWLYSVNVVILRYAHLLHTGFIRG